MGYYIPDDMWEALEDQPVKVQDEFFGAVARYFFCQKETPGMRGVSKSLFIAFRDRVAKSRCNERNRRKSKNETNNETGNETDNETHNEIAEEEETNSEGNPKFAIKGRDREVSTNVDTTPYSPPFGEIIGFLNEKAGTAFRPTSEATRKLIRARFSEGFTVDDFKRVIENKTASWGRDPKMRPYLRPTTLFSASKFEGYLNESSPASSVRGEFDAYRGR